MFLPEKTLSQQNDEIVLGITAETFDFQRGDWAKRILNDNTVKKLNQIIVLTYPADFVNI